VLIDSAGWTQPGGANAPRFVAAAGVWVLGTEALRQRANVMAYHDPALATRAAMLTGRLHTYMPGWKDANIAFIRCAPAPGKRSPARPMRCHASAPRRRGVGIARGAAGCVPFWCWSPVPPRAGRGATCGCLHCVCALRVARSWLTGAPPASAGEGATASPTASAACSSPPWSCGASRTRSSPPPTPSVSWTPCRTAGSSWWTTAGGWPQQRGVRIPACAGGLLPAASACQLPWCECCTPLPRRRVLPGVQALRAPGAATAGGGAHPRVCGHPRAGACACASSSACTLVTPTLLATGARDLPLARARVTSLVGPRVRARALPPPAGRHS